MNKGIGVLPSIIILVGAFIVLYVGYRLFLIDEPVVPIIDSTKSVVPTTTPEFEYPTTTRDMKG